MTGGDCAISICESARLWAHREWQGYRNRLAPCSSTPEPEAAAGVVKEAGHQALQQPAMEGRQVAVEQGDREGTVVLEERPEQVLLVPGPVFVEPGARILEWVEDVVDMHVDARCEAREDLKQVVVDVAVELRDVRGVDEKQVVRLQR